MKRFMMMFAMAQMIIWSCVKPEIDTPVIENVNPEDVVFTAVAEVTKATPAAGGSVTWTMDEEIGVYDGTNYVKATVLSVDGNKITFSASVNASAASYIAVSPYEAALTDGGAFTLDGGKVKIATGAAQTAGKQVISVASTTSASDPFSFKNVANLLRFKVNKAAVKKAKITGANGEKIAGVMSVDPATGEATGALSASEIVVDVTPGVDNFIAVASGVSLPNGFTITLYGSEVSEAGYEGEVASAGALSLTRNQMINLGLIDGWIDNYKLWQAGKPITIAGVEYTKESTGFAGTLLSATEGDVDLYPTLYGKAGAFFLETKGENIFNSSTFINLGSTSKSCNVILISRYDNQKVKFQPTREIVALNGNFAAKGIDFDITKTSKTYYFQGYTHTDYGNLHLDNCKMILEKGDYVLYFANANYKTIKSIRFVNSKIQSLVSDASKVDIIKCGGASNTYLDKIEEVFFQNDVFYNTNANGKMCLLNAYQAESVHLPKTILKVENNTFYNMLGGSQYLIGYSLGSLSFKGNLLYSDTPTNSYFAQTSDTTFAYPYSFENNKTNYAIYYFNINQPGIYGKGGSMIDKTFIKKTEGASSVFFSKADTENGIFIQTDAYASYGAKH